MDLLYLVLMDIFNYSLAPFLFLNAKYNGNQRQNIQVKIKIREEIHNVLERVVF